MRWKIIALVIFALLSGMQSANAESLAIKAATPVEVSIYPITSVSKGNASTFRVLATSSIPVENFVIKILPSAGSRVLSGDADWRGSMVPGVPQELTVTVQMANDIVPTISVNSSIQIGGDARFAASATYRQQIETPIGYKAVSKKRKVKRKGRQVVEYKLN